MNAPNPPSAPPAPAGKPERPPARMHMAILAASGGAVLLLALVLVFRPRGSKDREARDTPGEPSVKTASAKPPVVSRGNGPLGEVWPVEPAKAPPAAAPGETPVYRWQAKEIYRFQYHKVIRTWPDDDERDPRSTEFAGVLVLDVESAASDGTATAILRFDSPHVLLPTHLEFDTELAKPEADAEHSRRLARGMEECFRELRWRTSLGRDGRVRIESRTPADLREALQKAEQAGKWRRKSIGPLTVLIDRDLGLGAERTDSDLLVSIGEADVSGERAAPFDSLRPRRRVAPWKQAKEGWVQAALDRVVAEAPGRKVEISGMSEDEPPVTVSVREVTANPGVAVFDQKLGMLDRVEDSYEVVLDCALEEPNRPPDRWQKLRQRVRVEYRLNRLAPPIREPEEAAEPSP